ARDRVQRRARRWPHRARARVRSHKAWQLGVCHATIIRQHWALTWFLRIGMLTARYGGTTMKSGRTNPWTTAAFLVFALCVASTSGAQGGRGGAPYTPAAGAKDLRSVLFNWMWHQGMLKGADERDMV